MINIVGLSNREHKFQFHIDSVFFEHFGKELISDGQFDVSFVLDKHETFINTSFHIKGWAVLICDRSLEPFNFPLDFTGKILFKYAEQSEEISDEIIHITKSQDTLNVGQYIYEFIGTSLPMKRLHPKFQENQENEEGKIIFTSGDHKEETMDPRWEKLKKLK